MPTGFCYALRAGERARKNRPRDGVGWREGGGCAASPAATYVKFGHYGRGLLYGIGSTSDAVGEVTKGATEFLPLFGREVSRPFVTVHPVKLMIKPRAGFSEIPFGEVSPRDGYEQVVQLCLYSVFLCFL